MASYSSTPWGYLEPINPIYPRGILTKSSYTIGRHPHECDIILDSIELRQHEYFIHLSSKHFIIECVDNGRSIFFRDVSRNGCYIDGELVHHSKMLFQNNVEHIM
jgi:pSer/pThr/pTyr-binding forkhead associated (FHA) protein